VFRFRRIVADVLSGAAERRARPSGDAKCPNGLGEFSNPPTTYMYWPTVLYPLRKTLLGADVPVDHVLVAMS
jgi:hypothetical protein